MPHVNTVADEGIVYFLDGVPVSEQTYTYDNPQATFTLTNTGTRNLIWNVGDYTEITIPPSTSETRVMPAGTSSFRLRAQYGYQSFSMRSEEITVVLPTLAGLSTLKANQSDLNATNANVSANTTSLTGKVQQSDFGTLSNFKPNGNSIIDKLLNEFNDRGINVKWFGATGSSQSTTGSIAAGSNQLTVSSIIDFQVGHGISIFGAGVLTNQVTQLLITKSPTVSGNLAIALNNNGGVSIPITAGIFEVESLVINGPATSNGSVTVTLNGQATDITINSGDSTSTIASKISATPFLGWTTSLSGSTVTFTATVAGTKTVPSYSANSTGSTGSINVTTNGSGDNPISIADRIRSTTFTGYTTGGTTGTPFISFTSTTTGLQSDMTLGLNGTGVTGTTLTSVYGAGNLVSKITATNGTTITLADNAISTVSNRAVNHDDTSAIRVAIATLGKGDKIVFPKATGKYQISDALNFYNLENITIEVNGLIKQTKHGYCGIEIETCKNALVKGSGQVEGYGIFPYQSFDVNNRVVNEKSRNGGGFAINRKNGTAGTTGFGGGWEGNTGSGVMIYGSENTDITEIEIFGFNYGGVSIGWMNGTYNTNVNVTRCNIHNCQDNAVNGCKTYGASVFDNDVYDIGHPNTTINDSDINMGYGITNLFTNTIVEDFKVSRNRVKRCRRKGIDLHGCKNGASIQENTVSDCYVYGIATPQNSNMDWSELKVTDNEVRNCGTAPYILSSVEYTCGILFEASLGGQLTGNKVINSGQYGLNINIKSFGQTDYINLLIDDNFVSNTNSNSTYVAYIGIYTDKAVVTVSGNLFKTTIGSRALYCFHTSATNNLVLNIDDNQCIVPTTGTTYAMQVYQINNGSISNNVAIGTNALYGSTLGPNLKVDSMNTLIGTVNMPVPSYPTSKSGTTTYNGDGITVTKAIPHGLTVVPKSFSVTPNSADAGTAGIKFVTADATNLTVTFNTAPITGTNNVKLNWKADA